MQLLDAAQMGWWKADFRTGELFFSDYIVDLLGLGSNRAAVGELMPLTREDYRTRIHNEFLSLKVGNHFDETFPVVLPEGEIWIHTQLVRKQSDPQQGIKLFGYLQRVPVAGRKEADVLTLESNYYAVLKENKHMDELLDHLPIGYFRIRLLYDDDGRATDYLFLSVNQTAQQILGVDAADYLDKTAREIDIPVDRHIDELAAIRLGDYKMDQWHASKTGRYCRSFLYNTPNDATEIVILILDITDVVTAHQALDEKEKLLRNVIQNAPIGIEIYDRTGHLVDINARDLEMFGVTDPAGIRGLSIFDNPNFSAEIKDCIREGRGTDFTTRYDFSKARSYYDTSRSGYIDWTARIRCLYNDTGEITHYLLINIDNTELRQTPGPAHGIRSAVPPYLRIRAGGIHQLQPLQQRGLCAERLAAQLRRSRHGRHRRRHRQIPSYPPRRPHGAAEPAGAVRVRGDTVGIGLLPRPARRRPDDMDQKPPHLPRIPAAGAR